MSSAVYKTKRLDHLGLVAGFCQEIDLAAIIDKALGTSERRQNGYGHIITNDPVSADVNPQLFAAT
jgi:hypothetical protein